MPRKFASVDEQRAHWREKSNARYHRLLANDPDAIRAQKREQARRRREAHPGPGRRQRRVAACKGCGIDFHPRSGSLYHDQPCYFAHMYRASEPLAVRHARSKALGKSVQVAYLECPECGVLFTSHGNQRFCTPDHWKRAYNREYHRRTHKAAIRYWRMAPTPEAEQLAAEYFELRQMVREVLHGR